MQDLLLQLLPDSALYSLRNACATARRIARDVAFQKEMRDLEVAIAREFDARAQADQPELTLADGA